MQSLPEMPTINPSGQIEVDVHSAEPDREAEPGGHGSQVALFVAPIATLDVFAGHRLQAAAPAALHEPAPHAAQVDASVAPSPGLALPALHGLQLAPPVEFWNVPLGHRAHEPLPRSENVPRIQGVQVDELVAPIAALSVPGGHGAHAAMPNASE